MQSKWYDQKALWLSLGVVAGLCVSFLWPHERALASTVDRNAQFALITVPVGQQGAGLSDPLEGVFVLDFLTGTLKGAVLSRQTGQFVVNYYRSVADDFKLKRGVEPRYAISTGVAQLSGRGGLTFASGVIYVGELTSGKIISYSFGWRETRNPILLPQPLFPTSEFQFREPTEEK
jgi:hypothetical protein